MIDTIQQLQINPTQTTLILIAGLAIVSLVFMVISDKKV